MKKLIACFLLMFLAACETTPPPPLPELTFEHMPKTVFAVTAIDVVEDTNPAVVGTLSDQDRVAFEDDLLPMPFDMYIKRWASDRIIADGTPGHKAILTIKQATLKHEALKMEEGFVGFFSQEPSERIEGDVVLSLEITDDQNRVVANADVQAHRSKDIMESSTLSERRHAMFDLMSTLINTMDQELHSQMETYLSTFQSTAPRAPEPVQSNF
jgi:hypothetical protein